MTSPQQPVERPNGSFVKHTRAGVDARPIVSILVREDDPRDPATRQRWRSVEGRGGWFTWEQLHATGTVEPLFTGAEVAAAARSGLQPGQATARTAGARLSRDRYYWRSAVAAGRPRRGDLRLLAAVADGTVRLYGTHRPAVVRTATMRLRRYSLQVAGTAGAVWRVYGVARVCQRVGRLVDAGLLAEPLPRRRRGGLVGIGVQPYLLTRAGVEVLDRYRPEHRRHGRPPPTVESLPPHQPRARVVAAGAMSRGPGNSPGPVGAIRVDDAPGHQPALPGAGGVHRTTRPAGGSTVSASAVAPPPPRSGSARGPGGPRR